jgi:hypothetical protein
MPNASTGLLPGSLLNLKSQYVKAPKHGDLSELQPLNPQKIILFTVTVMRISKSTQNS